MFYKEGRSMKQTKKVTLAGVFIALSVVGSMITIMGSIALDSLPAFVGTVVLGPNMGFLLGFLAHLVTAIFSGMPLTLPIHFITAVIMGFCMMGYGYTRKKVTTRYGLNRWFAMLVAYLINVPLSLLVLYPFLKEVVYGLFVPLSIGALVNIILAEMLLSLLGKTNHQEF